MNKLYRIIIVLLILIPLNLYVLDNTEVNYEDGYYTRNLDRFDYCQSLDSDLATIECMEFYNIREHNRETHIENLNENSLNVYIELFIFGNILAVLLLFFSPEIYDSFKEEEDD